MNLIKWLLEMAGILWRWWLNTLKAKARRAEQVSEIAAEGQKIVTANPPKTVEETTHRNAQGKVGQGGSPLDWGG